MRKWIAVALTVLVHCLNSLALANDQVDDYAEEADNSIIIAIQAPGKLISEGFFGQQIDDRLYLPLDSFILELGFTDPSGDCSESCQGKLNLPFTTYRVDISQDSFSYFSFKAKRTLSLSVSDLIQQQEALLLDGQLQLNLTIWEDLLDASINWQPERLALIITSKQIMPWDIEYRQTQLQQRFKNSRVQKQEKAVRKSTRNNLDMAYIATDVNTNTKTTSLGIKTASVANFYKHLISLTANHDAYEDKDNNISTRHSSTSVRISRELDSKYVTNYSFGDIYKGPETGLHKGIRARGFTLGNTLTSNEPITEIQGDLLPDWHVELYKNDYIIGYDHNQSSEISYYKFTNITLDYGKNSFTIIKVSPYGEQLIEHKDIYFDNIYQSSGLFQYQLSGLRTEDKNTHSTVHMRYGIRTDTQLLGSFWLKQNDDTRTDQTAYSLSLRGRVQSAVYYRYDRMYSGNFASNRVEIYGNTPLGKMTLEQQYAEKPYVDLSNNSHYRSTSLGLITRIAGSNRLAFLVKSNQPDLQTQATYSLETSWSKTFGSGVRFTLTEKATKQKKVEYQHLVSGVIPYGKSSNRFRVSAAEKLESASLQHKYQINQKIGLLASINLSARDTRQLSMGANIATDYGTFNTQYTRTECDSPECTDNKYTLEFSTLAVKREHDFIFTDASKINLDNVGAITVSVYATESGVRKPVPEGTVKINNRKYQLHNGEVTVTNLSAYQRHQIFYDLASLPSFNLVPEKREHSVILQAGEHKTVTIELKQTGEIDGIVRITQHRLLSYTMLFLIDVQGNRFVTRSEQDGYFSFIDLPLTSYCLRTKSKKLYFPNGEQACFDLTDTTPLFHDIIVETIRQK